MALPGTPFAPDPGYENLANFYPRGLERDPTPLSRIKPEAAAIARAHTTGTVGSLFETMAHPIFTKTKYKRQDPKNFSKENLRRIRQIQVQSKARRNESSKPVMALPKSDKYDHISAKVTLQFHTMRSASAPRLGTPLAPGQELGRCGGDYDNRVPVNGSVAECPETGVERSRNNIPLKNFVSANIISASVKRPQTQQKLKELETTKSKEHNLYQRGTVPKYLRERQEEWRKVEEERIASLPDPSIPPGHTLMPAKERHKTLEVLRKHQSALTAELNSLPLQSYTLRIRQRKTLLESKLAEIEDALKIFTRPKVFVKLDD